ncbi:MAG TPA: serine/threonine-protein kinase [Kofleriaceae bacterium]|nr:serine/threonine-protein kinase [Kofleriaceae bacterium]
MTTPEPPESLVALVGRTLDGRYRLDALLGQGGMGAVFRAYHLAMERKVAVTVLRPNLVGDPIAARRFAREAKGTFKVASDHAVKVHDFAIEQSTGGALAYMVMEYLDGRTVGAELSVDGPFAPARVLHIMKQVCEALGAAHALGLVHRDIKPDNIMLQVRGSDSDFAKVLDFGLAKLADNAGAAPFSVAAITQGDMVFGTPDYMSPEQAKGQPLDGRSDLYAIGVTMFEMLTGRCPFVEANAILLLARHVQAAPPKMSEVAPELAGVPGFGAVEAMVARLLAKSKDDRPASAAACVAELELVAKSLAGRASSRDERSAASTMDLDAPPPSPKVPSVFLPSLSESVPKAKRRGVWIAIAAAVVVVAAGVIVAASAKHHASVAAPIDARAMAIATIDAGPIVIDASPSIDASISVPAPPSHPPTAPPKNTEAAAHVAAAEQARAAGNRLKQLAEADLALRKDPRNVEAKFLLGDALIATGDIQNGCQYLRSVKRLAKARAAASAAGCRLD